MQEHLALTVSERKGKGEKLKKKYPNKIPVMVKNDVGLPKLDKEKFLVPCDLLLSEFTYIVRQRIKLDSKKALLLMSNNELLNSCQTIAEIYERNGDKDTGFLYVTYCVENTFGGKGYINKSLSDDWGSPEELVQELVNGNSFFDPTPFDFEVDALNIDWTEHCRQTGKKIVYLNPPYSILGKFLEKSALESTKGCRIIVICPMRCSNNYWKHWVDPYCNFIVPWDKVSFISKERGVVGQAPFHIVALFYNIDPTYLNRKMYKLS